MSFTILSFYHRYRQGSSSVIVGRIPLCTCVFPYLQKNHSDPGGDFLLIVWQVEYSTTATCDTRMMTHVAAHFAELDGASADGAGDKVVPR